MVSSSSIGVSIFIIGMLAFLGVVFLTVGVSIAVWRKRRRIRCTLKVTAAVVENIHGNLSEPTFPNVGEADLISWFPVYTYDVAGKHYLIVSEVGEKKPSYAPGQQVELFVDPNDPESIFNPVAKSTFIACIFVLIGILMLLFSLVLFLCISRYLLG